MPGLCGKICIYPTEEFKRLGVFGDWEHPYLTMDRKYEATIVREFGKFVEKGGSIKG